jgi:hypothetical protein
MTPGFKPAPRGARIAALLGAASAFALATGGGALARGASDAQLGKVQAQIAEQAAAIEDQRQALAAQARLIEDQRRRIGELQAEQARMLDSIRATGIGAGRSADSGVIRLAQTDPANRAANIQGDPGSTLPTHPVGEAPAATEGSPALTAALPEAATVLTQHGRLVVDPSIEYDRSSSNRLVFRGIEIVPGVNLGLVDANSADRDTGVAALDLRYGLFRRLEVEARIPYVWRHDQLTVLSQQVASGVPAINQSQSLSGRGMGDVELAARYQINEPRAGGPYFIAGLRVKSRTGLGPYDVSFDDAGITRDLATGSGFWGVEPSLTMLLPSDPVVIFASLGYLDNIGRNINRDLITTGSSGGATHVGKADPGDSINASIGFGFALNDRFSFSLGYSHSAIMQTWVDLNGARQRSNALQVGAMSMGWSYRLRPNVTINNSFEFGVTSDAPNLRIVTRTPISF